MKPAKYSKK